MKKQIFIATLLLLSVQAFSQDTGKDPYAIFGHQSTTKYETKINELLYIKNSDTTKNVRALAFDMQSGFTFLLDKNDRLIEKIRVEPNKILRWLSVDPLTGDYPMLTPYQFASNSPILNIDLDGLEGMAGPPPGVIYEMNKELYDDLIAGRNTERVQNSRKAGQVIVLAGAVVLDVFLTKGWITRTVMGATLASALNDNKAKTPEGKIEQDRESWKHAGDAFLMWGSGKAIEKTVDVITPILKPVANRLKDKAASAVEAAKGVSWAKTSGILRDAVKGKGNYGLGSGTFDEAMQAGRSWVGEGFTISKDGSSWISSNGLRQFRPPSFKPKLNIEQANFQWRNINKGAWQSNGHLDIIKP